jgi:hypothetical protein
MYASVLEGFQIKKAFTATKSKFYFLAMSLVSFFQVPPPPFYKKNKDKIIIQKTNSLTFEILPL